MKYFNPSYWFKLWVLSAPLFNDQTQGINAKSIDNNQKIKNWANNNTDLELINQEMSYTNSNTNYQPYNLNETNQNVTPFYQTKLETSIHKLRHQENKNRKKRILDGENEIEYSQAGGCGWLSSICGSAIYASFKPHFWEEVANIKAKNTSYDDFVERFKNKVFNGVWIDWRIETDGFIKNVGGTIYHNFWTIANKFIDSSRRERIRIVIRSIYS